MIGANAFGWAYPGENTPGENTVIAYDTDWLEFTITLPVFDDLEPEPA